MAGIGVICGFALRQAFKPIAAPKGIASMRITRLILASILLAACGKQSPPAARPAGSAPAPPVEDTRSSAAIEAGTIPGSQAGESSASFFNPKNYPDAVQGSFADVQKLTTTERKYGMAPKRDPRVTYQDGIILMEHGDEAIREAKTDGMTFSFDAKGEHVGEFEEGKIIFATGRVVGRVGQLTRDGDTVTVKLAPVTITDIIKKGTFMMHSTFSTKDLIIYTAPDFPSDADFKDKPQQSNNWDSQLPEPQFLRTGLIQTQAVTPGLLGKDLSTRIPQNPPTLPAPEISLDKGLRIFPALGSDGGVGLNFTYNKNGILFNAFGQLVIPSPTIDFLLDIDTSGIKTFGIQISGAISLRMSIIATSDVERFVNVNTTTVTPLDLSLPCPIAGVPLALSFKTSFNLHTKFAAKTSTLTSSGSWGMNGTLFAGKKGGSASHQTPPAKATSSLAENVSGASLGINSVGGALNVRPMIGLGGFGFMTGVFLGVTFTGDIAKQASEARIDCHIASGTASVDSGVGYQLPGPVVDFVNSILATFTKYRLDKEKTIPGWGGPLFQINEDIPTNCGGMSGGASAPAKT
jgi:hypothetical protein